MPFHASYEQKADKTHGNMVVEHDSSRLFMSKMLPSVIPAVLHKATQRCHQDPAKEGVQAIEDTTPAFDIKETKAAPEELQAFK